MKKLITLLLVLTGMLSTASATEYSVFFKPSDNWKGEGVWYALYMYDLGSKTNWARFEEVGTTGIYKATYDTQYDRAIIFCKMNPGTSEMNWDYKDWHASNMALWRKRYQWYNIKPTDRQGMFTLNAFGADPQSGKK